MLQSRFRWRFRLALLPQGGNGALHGPDLFFHLGDA